MRKIFTTILATMALVLTGLSANADNLTVGYYYGDNPKNCPVTFEGEGVEISAAVYIPASYAATLKGNSVEKINACIFMRLNCEKVETWVRESLDGENLASASIEKYTDIKTGDNVMTLDKPYEIGDNGFYMGYTYKQKKKSNFINALPIPGVNTLWVKGPASEWENMSEIGTLCLQGILANDIAPEYDVRIVDASITPYYIISQDDLSGTITVRNLGSKPVTGFTLDITPDGMATLQQTFECNIAPNTSEVFTFNVKPHITSIGEGNYKVDLKISSLADGQDADPESNVMENAGEFKVIQSAFPRRVLVEEFTTEVCPNCPPAARMLSELIHMEQYERVEAICHHSGYYTDKFTLPADNKYVWFYNAGGSTYAPAFMVDRYTFKDIEENTPVFFAGSKTALADPIDRRLATPSFAMSKITLEPPTEKQKTITVSIRAERSAKVLESTGILTVYFVEDNVAPSSSGQSGASVGYLHQHVTRAVNDAWGVPIVWEEDGTFNYECTFNLMDYKRPDCKIVAVISNYNSKNPNDCAVENVNWCKLDGSDDGDVSGIAPVTISGPATVVGIYDLNGRRVNDYVNGLNIVVYSDGTSRKVMINK